MIESQYCELTALLCSLALALCYTGQAFYFGRSINMTQAIIYSLAICAIAAALEALFAGRGVKRRLAELRLPSYEVPFWGWIVIGVCYYAICLAILYRLFRLPSSAPRNVGLALLEGVMFINALWNFFFFRTRNLFHACITGVCYTGLAIALFLLLLLRVDRTAAWIFLPYILYLIYANIWSYRVLTQNPPR